MPDALQHVDAELPEYIDDVDGHPVFGNQAVLGSVEIHDAHADALPCRRQAEPIITSVGRFQTWPPARHNIIAVAGADNVFVDVSIRKRA